MQRNIPWLEIIATVSVAIIAVTVVLLLFPSMNSGTAAAWASAVGTFGAIIAAIWLATGEARQRQREAMKLARITAAGIIPRLIQVKGDLDRVIEPLLKAANGEISALNFEGCALQLKRVNLWELEEVNRLFPLPNQCAEKLASAAFHINACVVHFAEASNNQRVRTDLRGFSAAMFKVINEVNQAIKDCLEECERAVQLDV